MAAAWLRSLLSSCVVGHSVTSFIAEEQKGEPRGSEKVMKTIFDGTTLGGMKLKNRLIRSATWEDLVPSDGTLPEELFDIYAELAAGGVAAIVTGLTNVSSDSMPLPGTMSLARDDLISEYQRLTDVVKVHDCRIIAQLVIADPQRFDPVRQCYHEVEINDLTDAEISASIELFAKAAVRAEQAGFDGVQIHAAHGFFLSRFISPAFNQRQDDYGGSPRRRARILVEVFDAIRLATHAMNISTKINFCDYQHGGLMPADAVVACGLLAQAGIDWVEISANGTSRPAIKPLHNEAYFLDFALELKASVDVPVVLVGGHRSIENMHRILAESSVDYFSLSRPLICEPDLPTRWLAGDTSPSLCVSCNNCYRTHGKRCIYS